MMKRLILFIIGITLLVYVITQVVPEEYQYISSIFSITLAGIVSITCILLLVKRYKSSRFFLAFLSLGVGFLGYMFAEVTWLYLDFQGIETYPSVADYFYLIFYAGAILHLIFTLRQFVTVKVSHVLGIITLIALSTIVYSVVIMFESGDNYTMLFILLNSALVVLALYTVIRLKRTLLSIPWVFLSIGIIIGGIFDIVYYVRETTVGYQYGDIEDSMWILSDLIIVAGLYLHRKAI